MNIPVILLAAEALDVIYINIWSILISLLNLLIIFFILKKFLFKPVVKMVSEREEKAKNLISDAEFAKADAEASKVAYDEKLAQAEDEASEVIRRATATANRESADIIADAKKRASELMKQADEDIMQEKKKAINELKNDISDISLQIAEKVVEREIKSEDHKEFIDTFISDLGDKS